MGLPSGLGAQWCFIDETTYGVAPSLSAAVFYACKSDTLELKKTTKQGIAAAVFIGMVASLGWILLSAQAYKDVFHLTKTAPAPS